MRRLALSLASLAILFASLVSAQTGAPSVGAGVPPVIRFSGMLAVAPGQVPFTFGLSPGGERRRAALGRDAAGAGRCGGPLLGGPRPDHRAAH